MTKTCGRYWPRGSRLGVLITARSLVAWVAPNTSQVQIFLVSAPPLLAGSRAVADGRATQAPRQAQTAAPVTGLERSRGRTTCGGAARDQDLVLCRPSGFG